MSIFIPPSLNELASIPKLADALTKYTDPTERKKIEADIKNLYALNETEAKQHADAKALIKQNQDAVSEAKRITNINTQDKQKLASDRAAFEEEKRQEYQKISDAKLPTNEELVRAQALRDEARVLQDDIASRETALSIAKKEYEGNIAKLAEEFNALIEDRAKLEDQRKSVLELDQTVKAKVEAVRKFNI